MEAEEIQAMVNAGEDPAKLSRVKTGVGTGMTLRDRWRRTMHFQRVDRIPNMEFGYWAETLPAWHEQGMPREITKQPEAYAWFGIENWRTAPVNVMGLCPTFEWITLEEDDKYKTLRSDEGSTIRINKVGHKSIPQHLDFLLKDRASWEEHFKPRLQAGPERIPANWPELAEAYNKRDFPLSVPIGSMVGTPRNWIGFEGIATMVLEDPDLMEEIVETLCNLVCDTLSRVLPDVEFDFGAGWEDICYNRGPIVGYDFMRNVVMPRYRRITNLLHKHGCHIAWTDCDGNILPVLDCFIDGGLNCQFPVEVHGGSDPVKIRQRYPDALMQGGFCKMVLAKGKKEIRAEIERIRPLVEAGGFVPGVDHRVQADVPYENYRYYLKMKREIFGAGGVPQYDESKIG